MISKRLSAFTLGVLMPASGVWWPFCIASWLFILCCSCLCADFSDLQRGGNQSVSRLSSFGQTSTATITQATTSETLAGYPGTSDSASPAVGPPSSHPPSRQSEADKDATNQTSSSESDKDATSQTSSSESDKDATNQTPSSESGAAGLAASQNSESAVSTSGDASLNPSQQDSSRTAETSEAELAGDDGGGPTKRKPGRQRVHDWRRPIEKPRLYSMNPFCVPIRLLRLKPLLAATPSATTTTSTSTTGRRQSVSSSQSEASTSSYLWQKRPKNPKEAADQELEWNSIRQVTGLYKPIVPTSRKKKEAMHKTLLPAKMQVSSATMDAMKAALALRSKHKAVVESSAKPAGTVAPAKTAQSSPVITLPGGQRVVQVTSKASSAGTIPTHAFRCIELPDGKMALVPVTVTKLGSGLNPALSASEGNTPMPQPREQQRTPQAAPATSPSVSGIPSLFQSPLRAPLAGCSVSVGTSDENSQEVPTTIASRVRGSSLSVGKPQASAKLSAERTPQGQRADDEGVSEDSRDRSALTAGRKVVAESESGPKVTKQTDASTRQSHPMNSSSCQLDTTERRATRPQRLERSATRPQPAKEGAKQLQPVQQRIAQPQLVEHRAAQPQLEQKHAQSQPVEQRTTPIVEQRTAPSQPAAEQKTAQSQPVVQKLVQPLPAEQRTAQLQPTEQRPAQPRPLEQRAVLSQAVELRATQSRPAEQRPAQPPPAEQRPAQPPSAEQKPAHHRQLNKDQLSHHQLNKDQLNHRQLNKDQLSHHQLKKDQLNHRQLNKDQLNHRQLNKDQLNHHQLNKDQLNHRQMNKDQLNPSHLRREQQLSLDQLNRAVHRWFSQRIWQERKNSLAQVNQLWDSAQQMVFRQKAQDLLTPPELCDQDLVTA